MAELSEFFPSVRPIVVIKNRLAHFTEAGEMLYGLKYRTTLWNIKEDGADSFPYVQVYDVLSEDSYKVTGGIVGGHAARPGISDVYMCRLNIVVHISAGFVRDDPGDAAQKVGLLEWVALVKDAIETDETNGAVDTHLCGTIARPLRTTLVRTDFNQLSMSALVDIELMTYSLSRGKRTD